MWGTNAESAYALTSSVASYARLCLLRSTRSRFSLDRLLPCVYLRDKTASLVGAPMAPVLGNFGVLVHSAPLAGPGNVPRGPAGAKNSTPPACLPDLQHAGIRPRPSSVVPPISELAPASPPPRRVIGSRPSQMRALRIAPLPHGARRVPARRPERRSDVGQRGMQGGSSGGRSAGWVCNAAGDYPAAVLPPLALVWPTRPFSLHDRPTGGMQRTEDAQTGQNRG